MRPRHTISSIYSSLVSRLPAYIRIRIHSLDSYFGAGVQNGDPMGQLGDPMGQPPGTPPRTDGSPHKEEPGKKEGVVEGPSGYDVDRMGWINHSYRT